MTTVAINYGVPATQDQLDGGGGGTIYMLAGEEEVSVAGSATGVRWRAPNTTPGVTCIAKLYRASDGVEVATSDGAGFTPTPGVINDISFVTPFALTAGVRYVPAVLTRRYTFTGSAAFPFTATNMSGHRGRFKVTTAGNPQFPDQLSTTCFHIGMIVDFPDAASVNLTPAALTLTAQALDPVPGMVTTALSPAALTLSAQALNPVPGMVTIDLTPAALTLTAQPVNPAPGMVTMTLTPAVLTLTAGALAFPDRLSVLAPGGSNASTLTLGAETPSTLTASGL